MLRQAMTCIRGRLDMTVFFIVKGNREVADVECRKRRIFWDTQDRQGNEVHCTTSSANKAKIVEWYNETTSGPVPVGGLLWYSERSED